MRSRRRNLLIILVIALLISTYIIFIKTPGLDNLDSQEHAKTMTNQDALKRSENRKGDCVPLEPNVEPGNTAAVDGVYMKTSDTTRRLAKFPILPTISARVPKECNTKEDDIAFAMVNVVKSAITNQDRRHSIRQTWGAVRVDNNVRIDTVFVVGLTQDDKVQANIIEESRQYGDILQFDEQESAAIVPLKVLAGMQWAAAYLPKEWLYSSIDDDVIVHLPNVIDYIYDLFHKMAPPETKPVNVCVKDLPLVCVYSYQAKDVPARNKNSKWYMPPEKFPGEYWPVYCRGGMYTMPVKMVDEMFQISRTTEHLYLDDVWITGFMRRKLGRFDSNIIPAPHSIREDSEFYKFDEFKDILMQHVWGNINHIKVNVPEAIVEIWQKWSTSMRKGCSIEPVKRLAWYIEKQRDII